MTIELDRQDIINEIDKNYRNDAELFFEIIDTSCTSWEPIRQVTERLIIYLKTRGELGELEDLIIKDN